ncbi:hypothetical protein B0J11DRAFT_232273 [Dendryphion nanum]|uniref:DUF4604 domain-containing protein n=1 Tax=Dendryphion nanum TaxID=256645 RepID=A0A9P9E7S1_9PLEO|nr:hypothetical protein B0J11DRAFT_232273 [Dendryphion nanum]
MSNKLKNLTYEAEQPAFLRRLRGELTGDDSARHERPVPRNKRLQKDDDDDAPTYVLEDTNQSLTKAEYDALVAGKEDPQKTDGPESEALGSEAKDLDKQITKDNIAEVGKSTKKRKAAKVIGGDDEEHDGQRVKKDIKSTKKPKKKAKAVKLSFGEQEEG